MSDCVRLYVYDCQNFVSEKDYRAVLEQRRGFEQAALDNETAAKKAKEQLAACRREFFEYRKVAWENEEIGHKALDDLLKAREAGRREGLEEAARAACDYCCSGKLSEWTGQCWYHGENGTGVYCMAQAIRALIDSPKAEGEKTK